MIHQKKSFLSRLQKNVQLLPPDGADADAEAQMKLSLSVESGAAICRSNLEPNFCLGTEISFFRILHFLSAAVGAKKLFGTPSRRIPNLSVLGSFFFFVGVGGGGVKKSLSVLAPIFFFLSRAFFCARRRRRGAADGSHEDGGTSNGRWSRDSPLKK